MLASSPSIVDDGDGPLEAAGGCFEGSGVAGHAGFALLVPHPLAVISVACARRPEAMTDATSGLGACVGDGHAQVASIISIFGIIYTEERLKWLATDAVQRAEGGHLSRRAPLILVVWAYIVGRGGAGVVGVGLVSETCQQSIHAEVSGSTGERACGSARGRARRRR